MTASKGKIFIMRKLATLTCLFLLSACGDESDYIFLQEEDDAPVNMTPVTYKTPVPARSNGTCLAASASPTTLANDPLLAQQWHLSNTEQNAFSNCAGIAGIDINLPESLWVTTTGSGVKIGVLDTDIDVTHPDLTNNLNAANSIDFNGSTFAGDHATSVAGIIAAEKDNGEGGAGIAPAASISGLSILNSDNTNTSWAKALGKNGEVSANLDIFNQSFGYVKIESIIGDYSYNASFESYYKSGVQNLRDGKGALYFKAAGNYFEDYGVCESLESNSHGLPCQSANMDPDNNIPYNMVVAALNAKGMASSYSASGSSVLFSAPGGEYGVNNPAIITTDDINNNSSVNGQNGYTSKFNGTSSATPMVSGVAALILAKNPNLGWRDVRHILISSAKKVDNDIAAAMLIWETGETLTTEPTWQTNSAGYHFHNWYGFGLINAQAAVEAAGNYGSNLPAQQTKYQTSGTLNQAIPDNSNTGTSHILSVSEAEKLTVESVQIRLMLSHLYLSDLQVQLTSPNGMKSVLMTPRNGMGTSISNKEMVLLSQAFYGENSLGDWKLEVFDTNGGDTGTLHSWSMTIYGH